MDVPVIGMNKMAFDELQSVKEMKIVPGATHLFEVKVTESRKPSSGTKDIWSLKKCHPDLNFLVQLIKEESIKSFRE
jgi:hypothetical protein